MYEKDCYNHPFIYWNDEYRDYRGIMLTTSSNPKYENIKLQKDHFKEGFEIGYGKSNVRSKSLIAPLYLLKDVQYEYLEKKGELTDSGIAYISTILGNLQYTDWKTHMKQQKVE